MKPRDIVFVEGWDTTNGTYLIECEIVSVSQDEVKVKEQMRHYAGGRTYPGDGRAYALPRTYLETPLEERLRKQSDDLQWLIDQFEQDR